MKFEEITLSLEMESQVLKQSAELINSGAFDNVKLMLGFVVLSDC
jgi:hypothetical protein